MRSTPRSGAIDAVRVLGITAIVAGHVWGNATLHNALYAWHVPVFFFLTGYFWSTGRSFGIEVSNRSKTLARPYLFWLGALLVFSVTLNALTNDLTAGDVFAPVYGGAIATRPFSAFWFVTVLLFAALGYRVLERVPNMAQWGIIALGISAGYVAGDLLALTPLSIGSAWPCLAFIAAGELFRRMEPRVPAPLTTGVALLAGAGALVTTGLSDPLDVKQGDYGTPGLSIIVATAICAALVLVGKRLFSRASTGFHRLATTLAQAGLVVVLAHPVILILLGTTPAGGADDFLLALILPWSFGIFLLRTRLSGWGAGFDPPRRTAAQTVTPGTRGSR